MGNDIRRGVFACTPQRVTKFFILYSRHLKFVINFNIANERRSPKATDDNVSVGRSGSPFKVAVNYILTAIAIRVFTEYEEGKASEAIKNEARAQNIIKLQFVH